MPLKTNDIKISFYGASGEVTGSNFLLESGKDKILIDCGLFQGSSFYEDRNNNPFKYSPKDISAVIATHAHIDHIGRLPKLIKDGFNGKIYSNFATKEFAELMLLDSLGVLEKEAARHNKQPFYSEENVYALMEKWEGKEYNTKFKIGDLEINLKDAGHILGSAIAEITVNGKKIVFTGDLGNPPTPLISPTEKITGADFLILDSTYGGKVHEGREERKLKLERVIESSANKKGVLLIPAFSLERTQEILFEFNDLIEKGMVPKIPVFVDSPLSIKLIPIYKQYEQYYNKETKYIINKGDDVFNFPNLHLTLTTEESKEIARIPSPKIIIAGSGMMTGGRILHHAKNYLSDSKNTILFIGFQAANSLGRKIQEGIKNVRVMNQKIIVNASIETIEGYSAHPDNNGILDFIQNTGDTLKKIFSVHSEPKNSLFLSQRVRDYLGIETVIPSNEESFEL